MKAKRCEHGAAHFVSKGVAGRVGYRCPDCRSVAVRSGYKTVLESFVVRFGKPAAMR